MRQLSFIAFFAGLASPIQAFEISTTITINASPEQVWKVLTSFEAYPSWNPFIKEIKGEAKVGSKIHIIAGDMKFKPKVLVFEPSHLFEWRGRLLLPGIFDGRHRFELKDNLDGTTTLIHSEKFNGLLVPFLKKKLKTETLADFKAMNEALKELVERR